MTTLAAFTNGLTIWMACDGVTVEEGKRLPEPHKIARLPVFTEPASRRGEKSEALVGVGGASALIALVQHELDLEQAPARGDDERALYLWAHGVARSITRLALELTPPIVDEDGHLDGLGLLGFGGRLWSLTENAATPLPSAWAMGSGGEYALGAIHAQLVAAPERSPEDVLRTSLAAAIVHDASSGYPVVVESVESPYRDVLRRTEDEPTLPLPKRERMIVVRR
jgi:hypothetical protein